MENLVLFISFRGAWSVGWLMDFVSGIRNWIFGLTVCSSDISIIMIFNCVIRPTPTPLFKRQSEQQTIFINDIPPLKSNANLRDFYCLLVSLIYYKVWAEAESIVEVVNNLVKLPMIVRNKSSACGTYWGNCKLFWRWKVKMRKWLALASDASNLISPDHLIKVLHLIPSSSISKSLPQLPKKLLPDNLQTSNLKLLPQTQTNKGMWA